MEDYTITEVSKDMGIPSSTLRYYEELINAFEDLFAVRCR